MKFLLLLPFLLITLKFKSQEYIPLIEQKTGLVEVDSGLVSKAGYLIVPENRKYPSGSKIKLPFIYVSRRVPQDHENTILISTGGPGYSTIQGMIKVKYDSPLLKHGSFIMLDQRGTKNAVPSLECSEVGPMIRKAYEEGISPDSMRLTALKKCRERLTAAGINLSAYNTIESAADINDLRKALHLDSLVLAGQSYSGGLMLTVVRNHPEAVKALILSSPLPGYVNYEEHALFNMNEALNKVFDHCESDPSCSQTYKKLKQRFQEYFISITGKTFSNPYFDQPRNRRFIIKYSKKELMDAIINRLNERQLKQLPNVINEIITGHHEPYVKEVVDEIFANNDGLSYGMRLSVYCSEQIAYSDEKKTVLQYEVMPWFKGYAFNNVNVEICKCWDVNSEPPIVKTPVYSKIPALIVTGEVDPWCPQTYSRLIKQTLPNSQLLLIKNRGHVPGFTVSDTNFLSLFMADMHKKITSPVKDAIAE